ncbi:calcium-binding protein [Nocardioides sp. cx-173]|uniref:calcium-binding protein n=1 Tax=Nocardioides sp. cx-173 TaxID=2898796 RepID=UPI001E344931|nr:hypothetical protein [Nocardioides sp. cx-173]MCD4525606.1 hypothetical protein [Nocardioides sp. cx-173]UGB42748.1 hypothetical protein LQ940_04290 [Nocardioides sp. cx-173]
MSASRLAAALVALPLIALPAAAAPSTAAAETDPCASPTMVGTPGSDELTGTSGPDVIDGLGGHDLIDGAGGDDVLCGGGGSDSLIGGDGDDSLYGELDGYVSLEEVGFWEGDTLEGGPGDDLLDAGHDPRPDPGGDMGDEGEVLSFERAAAGVDLDLLAGTAEGEGTDTLVGDFHEVVGSDHADRIAGAAHDETILGRGGADTISGGQGDDHVLTGSDEDDDEDGADGANDGARDRADGGPGDDWLNGGRGDRLAGGTGDDFLDGSRARTLLGGPGRDVLYNTIASRGPQLLRGGPGWDRASLTAPVAWRGTASEIVRGRVELASQVARFHRRRGMVRVPLQGIEGAGIYSTGRWTLVGTPRNNLLEVEADHGAVLIGRGGNDMLRGSERGDVLRGGPGFDTGWGRGGRDRFQSIERRR